jgi:predicted dehydrogenase
MARTRSDEKVRFAVVGGGPFTRGVVLPAFEHTPNAELVAIVCVDDPGRSILAQRHGVTATGGYDELEPVLEKSGAQAIYLAAPCSLHRSLSERAARMGVHVLCDTPMAETVEACRTMIDCCAARGVHLRMAYRLHLDDGSLDAVARVREGRLGVPRTFTSVLTRPRRKDGGRAPAKLTSAALWELASYPIHAARHLFEGEPVRVFAVGGRGDRQLSDADSTLSVTLSFEDDRYAQFSVSLVARGVEFYRLIGERGDLLAEPAYGYGETLRHVLTIGDNVVERSFARRDHVAAQLGAFARAIRGDASRSEGVLNPTGAEGLADVRVLEALLESRRSGRSVDLRHDPHAGRTVCG